MTRTTYKSIYGRESDKEMDGEGLIQESCNTEGVFGIEAHVRHLMLILGNLLERLPPDEQLKVVGLDYRWIPKETK